MKLCKHVLSFGAIFFLVGCEPELPNAEVFKTKATNFCQHCDGLVAGFINTKGLDILCVNGNELKQTYEVMPTTVVLGNCK